MQEKKKDTAEASINMSDNSSSSNSSLYPLTGECFRSEMIIFVFSASFITSLLLLPVFIFVIYLACQNLRRRRSTSSTVTSRSDLFTYHVVAIHLNELLGILIFFIGSYTGDLNMAWMGQIVMFVTCNGKDMFHVLTCVELHLAVVRPITYLHLKQAGEVLIRHISAGSIWLLSFGWVFANFLGGFELSIVLLFFMMMFNFAAVSFCSISVLCALKRPGPEGVGGTRKRRAFYTVMAIMEAFSVRFVATLIASLLYISAVVGPSEMCVVLLCIGWFSLPSSLVLPLLFLHRAGKLQCLKQDTKSG